MKQTLYLRQQLCINLRYSYSPRRATQTMPATRNSPTIGLKLHALPLSAVTVSLHYLPTCQDVCVQQLQYMRQNYGAPFVKILYLTDLA